MTQPVTGAFTATGQSATFKPKIRSMAWGAFNVFLNGAGTATIQLERSYNPDDASPTWHPINAAGTQLYVWSYAGTNISETVDEPEAGIGYRLNCTAFTSNVSYRLSQG